MNDSNNPAPLVLIADDLPHIIRGWESELSEFGIGAVKATTLRELCARFLAHEHEIAAVILDGCIPGDSPNTIPFIQLVREMGFYKPIVASSGSSTYRSWMMRAGCSHEAPKEDAAILVALLLEQSI